MRRAAQAPSRALATLSVVALALTGCTGSSEDSADTEPGAQGSESASAEPPAPVTTRTTLGVVRGGKLDPQAKKRLKKKVTRSVDTWIEGAFAAPGSDPTPGWVNFTRGASKDAARDSDLMSNADVQAASARLTKRRLRIDTVLVDGRAVGVTARVALAQELEGEARPDTIRGDLFLTYREAGWKIFGYDMTRGGR